MKKTNLSNLRTIVSETVRIGPISEMANDFTKAAEQLSKVNVEQSPKDVTEKVKHAKSEMWYIAADMKKYSLLLKHDERQLAEIINRIRNAGKIFRSLEDAVGMSKTDQMLIAQLDFNMKVLADKLECVGTDLPLRISAKRKAEMQRIVRVVLHLHPEAASRFRRHAAAEGKPLSDYITQQVTRLIERQGVA